VDQLIDSFEDLARRYCKLLEDETPIGASIFARECLILLLRLYDGAMRLPDTAAGEEDAPRISHETWKLMFDSISARMPGHDCYWTVFEPLDSSPPSPVVGSLAEDVADIWRDLKSGLLLIDHGGPNSRNSAVWEWRFNFESHWGRHAVEAITVLHALSVDSSSRVDGA
jgi:hypothetical protein